MTKENVKQRIQFKKSKINAPEKFLLLKQRRYFFIVFPSLSFPQSRKQIELCSMWCMGGGLKGRKGGGVYVEQFLDTQRGREPTQMHASHEERT